MATRCFCPPDSWLGQAFALSDSSTYSSSRFTLSLICDFGRPEYCRLMAMFWATVRPASRLNCWKIMPIFFRA